MAYAKGTTVSAEATEIQIKKLLRKAGAEGSAFFDERGRIMVAFQLNERRITFRVPKPDPQMAEFWTAKGPNQHAVGGRLRPESAAERWEQAVRERWRQLLLCIKAKLESVEAGIESFDDAFLAHVTMPDGRTVGEMVKEGAVGIAGSNKPLMLGAPAQ
jgi:hypothetical protein